MSYTVRVRTPDGAEIMHSNIECINFVNPASHGDPFVLLDRAGEAPVATASDYDGGECLFINTAGISSVRVKDDG